MSSGDEVPQRSKSEEDAPPPDEFDLSRVPASEEKSLIRVGEFDLGKVPAPAEETSTVAVGSAKWAQKPHMRLLVAGAVLVPVAIVYTALGLSAAVGGISVEDATAVGGAGLFPSLVTIAATVVGYYFGSKD